MTGFWICFDTSVTQGFVENSPQYIFGKFLSIPYSFGMLRLKYTRVVNMSMVLCKLCFNDSQYWMPWVLNMLRLWMCNESKYAVLKGSEYTSKYIFDRIMNIPRVSKYAKVLNILGFWKCQASLRSDYSSSSAYTRVLNMPGLHKIL